MSMNLFVPAEPVMALVEAFDAEPSGTTDKQFAALQALEKAPVCTLVVPTEAVNVGNVKPLGDEIMPTEARLIARLDAACRIIDAFPAYSIFSLKFVSEQRRFLKELRERAR